MRKYILIIICILFLVGVSSCKKDKVFKFPKEDVQSLFVYSYNFETSNTTSNWAYEESDMKGFLNYLENLSGKKIDTIDLENLSGLFYGVELNAKNPYDILFVGDYAITYEGEYYLIGGKEAKKICQSIIGDTKVKENVSYIVNHRYLSLIEGHWNTKYMTKTNWTGEQMENVQLIGDKTSIDTEDNVMELNIVNNSRNTIEFGSKLVLETLVKEEWYNIDNMINDNVNLAWNAILYILDSGKSIEDKFYLNYYQPLPAGKYRLIKKVSVDGKEGYVAYEFNIE